MSSIIPSPKSQSFRQDVALISVLVNTDCKVRASRATVGMKVNAPLLLSRLPNSFLVLNAKTRQQVAQFRYYGEHQVGSRKALFT